MTKIETTDRFLRVILSDALNAKQSVMIDGPTGGAEIRPVQAAIATDREGLATFICEIDKYYSETMPKPK